MAAKLRWLWRLLTSVRGGNVVSEGAQAPSETAASAAAAKRVCARFAEAKVRRI
jgi:hypothetical protein